MAACPIANEFRCKLWQDDKIIPKNKPHPSRIFYFQVQIRNVIRRRDENGEPTIEEEQGPMIKKSFYVHLIGFLSEEIAEFLIHRMLEPMCIPTSTINSVVPRVLALARAMVAEPRYASRSVLPVVLGIKAVVIEPTYETDNESDGGTEDETEEDVERAIIDSLNADMFKPRPATKSSIEALEKIIFCQGSSLKSECMICLEEISVGLEVSRMPCSHLYHGDCIVRWLEMNHVCPLCRFEMPTSSVD